MRSRQTPASFGVQGPGESTTRAGTQALDLVDARLVVAQDLHVFAELTEVLDEVVGE